jgi:hypothetical protein
MNLYKDNSTRELNANSGKTGGAIAPSLEFAVGTRYLKEVSARWQGHQSPSRLSGLMFSAFEDTLAMGAQTIDDNNGL